MRMTETKEESGFFEGSRKDTVEQEAFFIPEEETISNVEESKSPITTETDIDYTAVLLPSGGIASRPHAVKVAVRETNLPSESEYEFYTAKGTGSCLPPSTSPAYLGQHFDFSKKHIESSSFSCYQRSTTYPFNYGTQSNAVRLNPELAVDGRSRTSILLKGCMERSRGDIGFGTESNGIEGQPLGFEPDQVWEAMKLESDGTSLHPKFVLDEKPVPTEEYEWLLQGPGYDIETKGIISLADSGVSLSGKTDFSSELGFDETRSCIEDLEESWLGTSHSEEVRDLVSLVDSVLSMNEGYDLELQVEKEFNESQNWGSLDISAETTSSEEQLVFTGEALEDSGAAEVIEKGRPGPGLSRTPSEAADASFTVQMCSVSSEGTFIEGVCLQEQSEDPEAEEHGRKASLGPVMTTSGANVCDSVHEQASGLNCRCPEVLHEKHAGSQELYLEGMQREKEEDDGAKKVEEIDRTHAEPGGPEAVSQEGQAVDTVASSLPSSNMANSTTAQRDQLVKLEKGCGQFPPVSYVKQSVEEAYGRLTRNLGHQVLDALRLRYIKEALSNVRRFCLLDSGLAVSKGRVEVSTEIVIIAMHDGVELAVIPAVGGYVCHYSLNRNFYCIQELSSDWYRVKDRVTQAVMLMKRVSVTSDWRKPLHNFLSFPPHPSLPLPYAVIYDRNGYILYLMEDRKVSDIGKPPDWTLVDRDEVFQQCLEFLKLCRRKGLHPGDLSTSVLLTPQGVCFDPTCLTNFEDHSAFRKSLRTALPLFDTSGCQSLECLESLLEQCWPDPEEDPGYTGNIGPVSTPVEESQSLSLLGFGD
nr:PREDICTED: uncharacterized protein LOC102363151 [Latimeria chalumnae]|eukprot:XP_006006928.1 PREDICTED: uncharacterized protein LOC102363151 [Latimeria chalumnae]